jgi:hypothetical protein
VGTKGHDGFKEAGGDAESDLSLALDAFKPFRHFSLRLTQAIDRAQLITKIDELRNELDPARIAIYRPRTSLSDIAVRDRSDLVKYLILHLLKSQGGKRFRELLEYLVALGIEIEATNNKMLKDINDPVKRLRPSMNVKLSRMRNDGEIDYKYLVGDKMTITDTGTTEMHRLRERLYGKALDYLKALDLKD